MQKKFIVTWFILSAAALVAGRVWTAFDPQPNNVAFHLVFDGQISLLLAIGYYCTPSGSPYGKAAFGFVVLMVIGIAFKILHYEGANGMIVIGLTGIFVSYVAMIITKGRFPGAPPSRIDPKDTN